MEKEFEIALDRIKKVQNRDYSAPDIRHEILNIFESLCSLILLLLKTVQELKNEINLLKGEQAKPEFEKREEVTEPKKEERMEKETKKWEKSSKKDKIKIDREVIIAFPKDELPPDAVFKGYERKIVQNIIVKTDNVLYYLEKYYSPSKSKTYTAKVDESIQNTQFGPETKALIFSLYYENRVTQNKIASFLNANGLHISEGTISNILIKEQNKNLTQIKHEILKAGLASRIYSQIDDTGAKIAGKPAYTTIVCNENYSVFFTNRSKSRATIKEFLTEDLVKLFVILVGDDAPQFKKIALIFALCWVHEERLFKKLVPILDAHKEEVQRVRDEIWAYYDRLKDYKQEPTEQKKQKLWDDFDELFSQEVSYEMLSKRLSLTLEKKEELLVVLDYPEVPLHNNQSEIGLREMVIKRKISGGVETEEGKVAWENNMSILETCKKLGIPYYDYMKGIFSKNIIINLPELILLQ